MFSQCIRPPSYQRSQAARLELCRQSGGKRNATPLQVSMLSFLPHPVPPPHHHHHHLAACLMQRGLCSPAAGSGAVCEYQKVYVLMIKMRSVLRAECDVSWCHMVAPDDEGSFYTNRFRRRRFMWSCCFPPASAAVGECAGSPVFMSESATRPSGPSSHDRFTDPI